MKHLFTLAYLVFFSFSVFAQWSSDPSVNTRVCDVDSRQYDQALISDNAGGVIVFWKDLRNQAPHLYAQHIDAQGNKKWAEGGVPIFTKPTITSHSIRSIKPVHDGEGGIIIVWADERNWDQAIGYQANIYAQRINAAGEIQWETDGNVICDAPGLQQNYNVIEDGNGGAFIVWDDQRSVQTGIYAQHIDHNGVTQWLMNGQPISKDENTSNTLPVLVNDENGGALIFWQQMFDNGNRFYKVQSLSASGTPQLQDGGLKVVTLANNDYYISPEIVSDGTGGAILSWYESTLDKKQKIVAQRITSSGLPVWAGNTISVYDGPKKRPIPKMISDNNGGAVLIWQHVSAEDGKTLWGQRINSSGQRLWPVNGLPLMQSAGGFHRYQLTTDGKDGAIIASAINSTADILAQKVTGSGLVQWHPKGAIISNAPSHQQLATLVSNGSGEALIFWEDYRSGDPRIYGTITDNEILLPVTLSSFNAVMQENHTVLSWTTSYEANNKGFDVERSADGKKFSKIGHVAAMDDAASLKNYHYVDATPFSGINYYRLKQLDHDGKFAYSKMAAVESAIQEDFSIYPNPSSDIVNIKSSKFLGKVEVVNMIGVTLMTVSNSGNHLPVDVSSLQPGLYVMKVGVTSKIFVKN
ncbi:T9SS type A sorting domain-containing protein [Dyadobacter sp. LJ53]|uniref:T9SS type A sorting domain-containing protein n=1 Tax=Dyadobacter chenwenxiniae TaxID=2906456 RepID=UPI001F28A3B7|nr:T9SS type A sorting domain-containing protein [Dyadobacter chenwenxiniae]MCF0049519.1 T9SS type A sorting domain-containing protein [Dyadobacter chenwenxiniae]